MKRRGNENERKNTQHYKRKEGENNNAEKHTHSGDVTKRRK